MGLPWPTFITLWTRPQSRRIPDLGRGCGRETSLRPTELLNVREILTVPRSPPVRCQILSRDDVNDSMSEPCAHGKGQDRVEFRIEEIDQPTGNVGLSPSSGS